MKTETVPKLRRAQAEKKITLYFDKETDDLYRKGKINGYDVAEIARRAVRRALTECRDVLLQPAENAS